MEVTQGNADGFLYDQMSVWKNAQEQLSSTRALLSPIQKENWAIGLRLDSKDLREKINIFLQTFRASGGFEKLGDKYLSDQKAAFQAQGIAFYF